MRVSRAETQDLGLQRTALERAGCERLFSDMASSGRWDRPGLQAMLDQLRAGDEVLVWKLDRVSRSMADLVFFIDELRKRNAGLRSLTEAFDTTGPSGRMMAQMLGVIAEYERELIIERTRAGLAEAKARGRVGGRPAKLKSEQKARIVREVNAGTMSQSEAARLFGVSASTVTRLITNDRRQTRAEAL